MSIYTRVFHIMMGILFIAATTSCGSNSSKSEKAKMSILPEKPIVITADTVDGDDNTITAPWFSFRASMSNSGTDQVTIVALEVEVTGTSESGTPTTGTVSFSPSEFNGSIEIADPSGQTTITVECKFWYFAEVGAGQTKDFKLYGADSRCGTPTPVFFVGSNPKGPKNSPNYRYTLRMKPLGWFGTFALPTDRYERTQTFYTQ